VIVSHDPSVWVTALLTLAVFSFLWRENPVFRFAEHLLVGVSAGYYVVQYFYSGVVKKLIVPVQQDFAVNGLLIFGGVLGLLMFARLSRRLAWLARYPIAFYVAAGAGYFIPSILEANVLKQIGGTLTAPAGATTPFALFSAVVIVAGVLASLVYFYFSIEHRGAVRVASRTGILFLMIGFGASFGYTVMGRITLLIGRLQFLFHDWLGLGL
jgi:hypothetical protein